MLLDVNRSTKDLACWRTGGACIECLELSSSSGGRVGYLISWSSSWRDMVDWLVRQFEVV